jgi:hypothetical protein
MGTGVCPCRQRLQVLEVPRLRALRRQRLQGLGRRAADAPALALLMRGAAPSGAQWAHGVPAQLEFESKV